MAKIADYEISGLLYSGTTCVAFGVYNTFLVTHDIDSEQWTDNKRLGEYPDWKDGCIGDGEFIVMGNSGTQPFRRSSTGNGWGDSSEGVSTLGSGNKIIHASDGRYLVCGGYADHGVLQYTETTGFPFVGDISTHMKCTFYGVAEGNGRYVLVGDSGSTWSLPPSLDDTSAENMICKENFHDVVFGDKFVAVGDSGRIAYSDDGISWELLTVGSTNWYAIDTNGSAYVVVGNDGFYTYSFDGINWKEATRFLINGVETHVNSRCVKILPEQTTQVTTVAKNATVEESATTTTKKTRKKKTTVKQ